MIQTIADLMAEAYLTGVISKQPHEIRAASPGCSEVYVWKDIEAAYDSLDEVKFFGTDRSFKLEAIVRGKVVGQWQFHGFTEAVRVLNGFSKYSGVNPGARRKLPT